MDRARPLSWRCSPAWVHRRFENCSKQHATTSRPSSFIDELDAAGMKRSGNSFNREHDQTLNQWLVELDGFQGAPQVVVIGASNRLEDLDPALLRPGRFDRQVLVMPPDLAGRISILDVHTRGKPLGPDMDLEQIARQTSGLTGADLANLCNEAAISAGRAAEQVVFGRTTNGAANDLERATELARSMVFEYGMGEAVNSRTVRADNYALSEHTKELRDAEQSGLTDRAFHNAIRLLGDHRSTLDALASGLLDRETLLRPELEELLADIQPDLDSSSEVSKVVPLVSEG